MKTMKALRFEKYGPPSALTLPDVNVPDLKPGQVLVEVRASAVNPSDVKNVAGGFNASMPRVPGRHYAGIVVAGDGWIGKEVWGRGAGFGVTRDGTHAAYLVVQSDWLSEKPSHLSMEEAAAVGVPYLAAWSALVEAADIRGGETVLITGVSGAVGRAATQIAHWKGAKVIGAEISGKPSDADMFINAKGKDLPTEIKVLTDGKGVDLVLDAVGGQMLEPALKSLRPGGRQVAIARAGNRRVEFNLIDFYHDLKRLIGVTMMLTGKDIVRIMDGLRSGFEEGHLKPSPVKTRRFQQAIDAYSIVERGDSSTKHILFPQQS